MYEAIVELCKFVKSNNCEIEYDEIYYEARNIKRKILAEKYKELKDNKKNNYWEELEKHRRMVSNYFVKINIFLKNRLITKKLIKSYWNKISIHFLAEYVLTLEYIGQTYAKGGTIENCMKPPHLIELYNKCFIEKNKKGIKNKIKEIDFINIFYNLKTTN